MYILGINAYHPDSSACLLKDGIIVCAIEEERIRRIKHWAGFPSEAIRWCLFEAGINLEDIQHISINQDVKANLGKKIIFTLTNRPSFKMLFDRFQNKRKRLDLKDYLLKAFPNSKFKGSIHSIEHHTAHLSSAFHVSPFNEAAVVSVDGFGDLANLKQKKLGSPLDSLEQDLKTALSDEIEKGQAKLELNQDWLTIELNSGLLFGSGSSASTNEIEQVVSKVYNVINTVENYIRVRGYTDNQPINNEVFSSNWELSVSRATQMLLALEREGINPARMAIEGYGQYAPFADNSSALGRAENRKVVIALSKYGIFSQSDSQIISPEDAEGNEQEFENQLKKIEQQAVDDKTIKIINLPDGGIRITTREKEQ